LLATSKETPFTTPEFNDQSVLLISVENIIDKPRIPTTAPNKIGHLIGFLKNKNPLNTVNKVSVEKIRATIPETK